MTNEEIQKMNDLWEQVGKLSNQINELWGDMEDAWDSGNNMLADDISYEIDELTTYRDVKQKELDRLYYKWAAEREGKTQYA